MHTVMALDIETVPQREYEELSPILKQWVDDKLSRINSGRDPDNRWDYAKLASLDGDLGKVICISLGLFEEENERIRLKSAVGTNEAQVLAEFNTIIDGFRGDYIHYNGLGFDIPFLLQRMGYHGITPADARIESLAKFRKSPHFDLMQIWANWDYTRTKPLNVLADISGLPNPKQDMDGSMVYDYYNEGKLSLIKRYCEFDTATVLNLYLHLIEKRPVVPSENYEFSSAE